MNTTCFRASKCCDSLNNQGMCHSNVDSVNYWLQDMRLMTENECTCILQTKSVIKDQHSEQLVICPARNTKDIIEAIQGKSQIINSEFSKLFKSFENERWSLVQSNVLRVVCHMRSLLHDYNIESQNPPTAIYKQQQAVMRECAKLVQCVESQSGHNGSKSNVQPLLKLLSNLGHSFSSLVDMILVHELQKIIHIVEEGKENIFTVKSAINNITSLGLEGNNMCQVIAKAGAVRALFAIIIQDHWKSLHNVALRAVATVCCVAEGIKELELAGGLECLSDILCDTNSDEHMKSEAAGVIAQITSPWIEYNHHVTSFHGSMSDLMSALTELCHHSSTSDVFLLGATALANMTFMDNKICAILQQLHTVDILIKAYKANKANSLFAKDQIVTILANMAAIGIHRNEVIQYGGLELLLELLQLHPNVLQSEAENEACERVQQKSAIALSRLCNDSATASSVVDLQGIPRLVQLCKEEKERNHSDAVLVACLAAIRKIATSCGMSEFKDLNAEELVQPKLLDSFLIYSSKQESYV